MSPTSSSLTSTTTSTRVCAGDVARSSTGAVFSCSETDWVATAVPVSESSHSQAMGNRLHTVTQAQNSPEGDRLNSKERQVERDLRRQYRDKSHHAVIQRELLHQEERAQQQWETACLRENATKIAAYTSTKLRDEFHTVENETSRDEFHHQMQDFDTQAEEALDVQKHCLIREADTNLIESGLFAEAFGAAPRK